MEPLVAHLHAPHKEPTAGTGARTLDEQPPLVVHFDGLCQPINPGGIATFGFTVRRGDELLAAEHGLATEPFGADSTSNVAEYTGLVRSLRWLEDASHHGATLDVRGDSQLVVNQVAGLWKTNEERLRPLVAEAQRRMRAFAKAEIKWIPRAENAEADALTHAAYVELVEGDVALADRVRPHLAEPWQVAKLAEMGVPAPKWMSRMDAFRILRKRRGEEPPASP